MQLNRGLSVWQKPKDFFYQILSFVWKGHDKRLRGQTVNKTVTNQNHTKQKRSKTVILNQALFVEIPNTTRKGIKTGEEMAIIWLKKIQTSMTWT